jgi:hypothetical protein
MNILALEERIRAVYLAKKYKTVLYYLKEIRLKNQSELLLEIHSHSLFLLKRFQSSSKVIKYGLRKFPRNQNLKYIQSEISFQVFNKP